MNRKLYAAMTGLCAPGDRVVCALSGGADSVALLHGLLAIEEALSITVSAAHFNHCLRGSESDADEAFVRALCQKWNVELTVGRGDPRTLSGKSPEEAARELRYDFLLSQPGLIATAHHGDDQVETVLLNLLRGTGLKGLCGMMPKQGRIIRPLLDISQQEILDYVHANGLSYCTDRTNLEDEALRNRLRHHVVPLLKEENPNLTHTVCRMTKLLRQDEACLDRQAEDLLKAAQREKGYDCPTLWAADPVLRRRAIRRLLPNPKPSMAQVEAVEQLLQRQNGSCSVELSGGMLIRRTYALLTIEQERTEGVFEQQTVRCGAFTELPGQNRYVSLTGPVPVSEPVDNQTAFAIRFQAEPVVQVRSRLPGDTIRLPGGTKTLKKWMIDRKVPAHLRDRIPVFADEQGVIAVFGLGCDESRKALPGEQAWILRVETKERDK